MEFWKKLSHAALDERITNALHKNIDYSQKVSLGIPASKLDPNVFSDQVGFLKDAPLLRAYVQNPNHIGCHTQGDSEAFFAGTQELEKEVIELLAVDVFHAEHQACDGYIAAGGTEANIQAMWIYRNLFIKDYGASHNEIAIISSEDSHYSMAKAANLLHFAYYTVLVDESNREILPSALEQSIINAKADGIRYFIAVANMGTTMFGSIDSIDLYTDTLKRHHVPFKLHVDGAFGGFVFPITDKGCNMGFNNPHVSSITLDAHKMLQAPYGTGVFLARKGLMKYVSTQEAQYVNGLDITLSGSRSGTNAIAVWMILMTYGPFGWLEKINKLIYRTDWCCKELDILGIPYYRHPKMNIITIKAHSMPQALAEQFGLVPDTHTGIANWYKIVVMDHVELEHLKAFIQELKKTVRIVA